MKNAKTYAESQGKKPFDWNAFLDKKTYTIDELSNAAELASNWVTCACGNQCYIIPRGEDDWDGGPVDGKLNALGVDFMHNIEVLADKFDRDIDIESARKKAKSTLAKIEKRSSYLIQKEVKEISKKLTSAGIKHKIW